MNIHNFTGTALKKKDSFFRKFFQDQNANKNNKNSNDEEEGKEDDSEDDDKLQREGEYKEFIPDKPNAVDNAGIDSILNNDAPENLEDLDQDFIPDPKVTSYLEGISKGVSPSGLKSDEKKLEKDTSKRLRKIPVFVVTSERTPEQEEKEALETLNKIVQLAFQVALQEKERENLKARFEKTGPPTFKKLISFHRNLKAKLVKDANKRATLRKKAARDIARETSKLEAEMTVHKKILSEVAKSFGKQEGVKIEIGQPKGNIKDGTVLYAEGTKIYVKVEFDKNFEDKHQIQWRIIALTQGDLVGGIEPTQLAKVSGEITNPNMKREYDVLTRVPQRPEEQNRKQSLPSHSGGGSSKKGRSL